MKTPKFFGLHAKPGKKFAIFLMAIPFILLLAGYFVGSEYRHNLNPRDKIVPVISSIYDATVKYATKPPKVTRDYKEPVTATEYAKAIFIESTLAVDAAASLKRLGMGIALSALVGLLVGVNMALFPGMAALLNPTITFFSNVPPIALMPILLITMGTGEVAKVMLIFIGTVFMITRDVFRATDEIPKEQITKALTLGATQLEVVYKIIIPQIIPSLLSTIRLSLAAAWLYVIAGELVASSEGLGYQIFKVKRYLAMNVIIPYVFTITGLAFAIDRMIKKFIEFVYPWYVETKGSK